MLKHATELQITMAINLLLVYIYIYNLFILLLIIQYMFVKTRYFYVVDSLPYFHGTVCYNFTI